MSYRSSVDSTGCRLSADLEFLVSTNLKPARKPKQAKPRFWIFWMRMEARTTGARMAAISPAERLQRGPS